MTDQPQNERYGPQTEVWNHLWSAIDQASDELRALEPESRKLVEELGKIVAQSRTDFVLQPSDRAATSLPVHEKLLADAWFRHAAEIEIATLGVTRADGALARCLQLRPIVTSRPVPDRATRYIREVIDTYIFGFDAACIALCRAACEQVLRDALVGNGVYTEARLRRERPTAGALMVNAKRAGLLKASVSAAEKLIEKGDTVVHNFIYEERILQQQALDSITHLAQVLVELLD